MGESVVRVRVGVRIPGAIILTGVLITGAIYDVAEYETHPLAFVTMGALMFFSMLAVLWGD